MLHCFLVPHLYSCSSTQMKRKNIGLPRNVIVLLYLQVLQDQVRRNKFRECFSGFFLCPEPWRHINELLLYVLKRVFCSQLTIDRLNVEYHFCNIKDLDITGKQLLIAIIFYKKFLQCDTIVNEKNETIQVSILSQDKKCTHMEIPLDEMRNVNVYV